MSDEAKVNLHGLRVLVTRPKPMGDILCQVINTSGGIATYFPTIDICPPRTPSIYQMQLKKIDRQDWLIFISPQAVYATSELIHLDWPNFPPHIKIAAIGGGTAKALQHANLRLDAFPTENWSSEALLNLPEFSHLTGKKIALMSGEGGRDFLQDSLVLRGAIVSKIIVYRRVKPNVNTEPYCAMLRNNQLDCAVVTSGEGLRNLMELCASAWSSLRELTIIVISSRMMDVASEYGFKQILLAKNPSHNAIMAVLSNAFSPK
jgi:uroporphyrinogen-III synthase